MHMPRLAQLHQSMKGVAIERIRFRIQHAHLTFEGIFLADARPYQLGLACLAHNFTLTFDVDQHYELTAYIHDENARNRLMNALNLGGGGPAFRAGLFMQQIDAALPANALPGDRAQPSDLARFRSDVEEANKIYLCGWRDNNVAGERVRPENLAKTRALIDEATFLWCSKHNISTCWTHDRSKALTTINKPQWSQYP